MCGLNTPRAGGRPGGTASRWILALSGSVRLDTTLVAVDGPLFVVVITNWKSFRTTIGFGAEVNATDRSAAAPTVSVAIAVLFAGFGSVPPAVMFAVAATMPTVV